MAVRAYRVVARVKNNRLWRAILDRWPDVKRQSDAARRLGITPSHIGDLLNFTHWPGCRCATRTRPLIKGCPHVNGWLPLAWAVADVLFQDPAYLFDRSLYGTSAPPVDVEIDISALVGAERLALSEGPDVVAERAALRRSLVVALADLTPKESSVIVRRFGIGDDMVEHTLEEVGQDFAVTSVRIRQIEAKALRKLRHPSRSKALRSYVVE